MLGQFCDWLRGSTETPLSSPLVGDQANSVEGAGEGNCEGFEGYCEGSTETPCRPLIDGDRASSVGGGGEGNFGSFEGYCEGLGGSTETPCRPHPCIKGKSTEYFSPAVTIFFHVFFFN